MVRAPGAPLFRGHLDERQWRYATWDEARAGHYRIVQAVRDGTDPDEFSDKSDASSDVTPSDDGL